jgi:hypothetical protein
MAGINIFGAISFLVLDMYQDRYLFDDKKVRMMPKLKKNEVVGIFADDHVFVLNLSCTHFHAGVCLVEMKDFVKGNDWFVLVLLIHETASMW